MYIVLAVFQIVFKISFHEITCLFGYAAVFKGDYCKLLTRSGFFYVGILVSPGQIYNNNHCKNTCSVHTHTDNCET